VSARARLSRLDRLVLGTVPLAESVAILDSDYPLVSRGVGRDMINGSTPCHTSNNAFAMPGASYADIPFTGPGINTDRQSDDISWLRNFDRAILIGLQFLVAADIINTVAVEPTFRSVGVLAVIVSIWTFLSFALEVEIEGRWPWARAQQRLRVGPAGNPSAP